MNKYIPSNIGALLKLYMDDAIEKFQFGDAEKLVFKYCLASKVATDILNGRNVETREVSELGYLNGYFLTDKDGRYSSVMEYALKAAGLSDLELGTDESTLPSNFYIESLQTDIGKKYGGVTTEEAARIKKDLLTNLPVRQTSTISSQDTNTANQEIDQVNFLAEIDNLRQQVATTGLGLDNYELIFLCINANNIANSGLFSAEEVKSVLENMNDIVIKSKMVGIQTSELSQRILDDCFDGELSHGYIEPATAHFLTETAKASDLMSRSVDGIKYLPSDAMIDGLERLSGISEMVYPGITESYLDTFYQELSLTKGVGNSIETVGKVA